jgi:protein involved in polysaccharide export with SLBB domain
MEVVVGGAVVKSGNTQLTEHSSVFQAVYEAGVVDQTNLRRVYVIRDDGERLKVTEVDFHRMIDEGDTRLNLELQSGDVVYVSYTR